MKWKAKKWREEKREEGEEAGREEREAEQRGLFYDLQQMDQKGWGRLSAPPSVIWV